MSEDMDYKKVNGVDGYLGLDIPHDPQPTNDGTAAQIEPRDKQLEQQVEIRNLAFNLVEKHSTKCREEWGEHIVDYDELEVDIRALIEAERQASHTAVVEARIKELNKLMKAAEQIEDADLIFNAQEYGNNRIIQLSIGDTK